MIYLLALIISFFAFEASSQDNVPVVTLNFSVTKDKNVTSTCLSFDGNYMIFVVNDKETWKFYETQKINGTWTEPKHLEIFDKALGEKTYKNAPVYNYDASEIYFEVVYGENKDIFFAKRVNGLWQEPEKLPETINTPTFDEGEPSISPDNNYLYFIRFTDPKDKESGTIYVSQKDNEQWQKAQPIIEPISLGYERWPRVLIDNKTLIFSSKLDGNFKIYYTKRFGLENWLIPTPVELSNKNIFSPTIDYKENHLYFLTQKSTKKSEINYTSLPPVMKTDNVICVEGKITSENNKEIKGFIDVRDPISLDIIYRYQNNLENGKFIFFIPAQKNYLLDIYAENFSHYFYNLKENSEKSIYVEPKLFDTVFFTIKTYDNLLYEPLNVNLKITDTNGNLQNLPYKRLDTGVLTLNLPLGNVYEIKMGNYLTDTTEEIVDLTGVFIHKYIEKNFELNSNKITIKIKVLDIDKNKPIDCDVIVKNLSSKQEITSIVKTDENGFVAITGRKGDNYSITISPKGYTFSNLELVLDESTAKDIKVVELKQLSENTIVKLNNINFELNSAELKQEAYEELNRVVELLKLNDNIKIEISAHTDDIGSDAYNMKLSEKRAKSVVDFLIKNDIPKERLIARGYGESQPLVPNTSDQNRAINRRVEFKVIEIQKN